MQPAAPPGPAKVPLLGARGNFAAFLLDPIGHLKRLHETYGDIASLARGSGDYVFVFTPRYNQILLSDTDLFHNLDTGSSPVRMPDNSPLSRLYAGLTNMNGPRHRYQRGLLGSALRRREIEEYGQDIADIAERQMAEWRVGQEIDVPAEMRRLTLAVAVKTFLGLEPDLDGRMVSRLLRDWMDTVFSAMAILLPFDLPGLPYHRLMVLSDRLESLIRALIVRRRAGYSSRDVLSRLTKADDGDAVLTDEELIGEVAFLFMAGHATTASALTWSLLFICTHPDVQRALLDELHDVSRGRPADVLQLAELDLLDRVIKESLRLLPPVMWWGRVSTRPCELGGHEIRAGTHVMFSSLITHRCPELYPRPSRFLPDRWLTIAPGPYEYLPFSAGPRTCLGRGFALMEMKLVLATVLRRWQVALNPGQRIDCGGLMVSQPRRGFSVRLCPPHGRVGRTDFRGDVRSIVDFE